MVVRRSADLGCPMAAGYIYHHTLTPDRNTMSELAKQDRVGLYEHFTHTHALDCLESSANLGYMHAMVAYGQTFEKDSIERSIWFARASRYPNCYTLFEYHVKEIVHDQNKPCMYRVGYSLTVSGYVWTFKYCDIVVNYWEVESRKTRQATQVILALGRRGVWHKNLTWLIADKVWASRLSDCASEARTVAQ
jgi:hypothetical protein